MSKSINSDRDVRVFSFHLLKSKPSWTFEVFRPRRRQQHIFLISVLSSGCATEWLCHCVDDELQQNTNALNVLMFCTQRVNVYIMLMAYTGASGALWTCCGVAFIIVLYIYLTFLRCDSMRAIAVCEGPDLEHRWTDQHHVACAHTVPV